MLAAELKYERDSGKRIMQMNNEAMREMYKQVRSLQQKIKNKERDF